MSLPAKHLTRQASVIALVAGAVLFAGSAAVAQDLVLPELRRGSDTPRAGDLERAPLAAPGAGIRPGMPGGVTRPAQPPEDTPGRPDAAAADEVPAEPATDFAIPEVDTSFDLFDGPAEPAGVLNPPAGILPAPAAAADARLPGRAGREPGTDAAADPLRKDDLAGTRLPVGAVEQLRAGVGERLNLPAQGSVEAGPPEDDPFAPVGLRAGRFVLYSTLEQSLGVSSNLDRIPDGEAGAFSDTAVSARLLSDWSRHEAEINALAGYQRNFAGQGQENPRAAADARLRLDIDNDTAATLRGAFEYRREDASELDDPSEFANRPEVLNASGSAEIERRFGHTVLGLTGSAAREAYFDDDGDVPEESFSTFTAAIRGGYEISPALQPFLEASIGHRAFDEEIDAEGRSRASMIQTVRAGVDVDFGEKLRGEAAVGYARNVPEDDGLPTHGTPTFDARIDWSPRRGTDVTLSAATSFEPEASNLTTTVLYETALGIRHRLNARTDLTARVSAEYSESDIPGDDETTFGAEAGFTYWLNRALAFTGLVSHERLRTETGEDEYSASTARIGIRLQR